jgi:hypothetical protein
VTIDKNFYNESSAKNLGWDPTWFGEKHYDDQLTRAIKKWQRERGLTADVCVVLQRLEEFGLRDSPILMPTSQMM